MAHGHAHDAHAGEPEADAPVLASIGFALGIVAIILVVTIKLSPVGFMLALVGIVCCVLGIIQGAMTGGFIKGAVAGLFCNGVSIVMWVLLSGSITSIAGGRDAWPSWIFF
jgi:hypothetical protein